MKLKILVYGTGKGANDFIEKELNFDNAEILAFVETKKTKEEFNGIRVISVKDINALSYDLLIVASTYVEEIKVALMQYNANMENCVFLREIYAYKKYKRDINSMLLYILSEKGNIEKYIRFIAQQHNNDKYSFVEINGKAFVGKANDYIPENMVLNNKVYSEEEICTFLKLAEEYYNIGKNGYFFDCGCNILTTAVYALSLKKDLKSIAFEPIKETYKIARVNAILNGMEDRITLVNKGLSDRSSVSYMSICKGNCGGNMIENNVMGDSEKEYEQVETITLDEWCKKSGIRPDEINYIWIDAEGYEGYIIEGAKELLGKKKIALYLEYNKKFLKKSGCYEMLLKNLQNIYSRFIKVEIGGVTSDVYSTKELETIEERDGINLFMIP